MGRRLLLLALGVAVSLSTSVRAQTSPAMAVDGPANNATVAQPFWITGWAVDTGAQFGTGIDAVHVWAYPQFGSNPDPIFFGAAELGGSRPDVGAVYGSQFTNSGFGFQVLGQQPGTYVLVVSAHSAVSGAWDPRSVTVTITANPAMAIDGPTHNADVLQPFTVGGWAVDRAAATGTGVDTVHVWAYPNPGSGAEPIFIGASYMGGDRPDVGAAFGSRFAPSGFNVTFSGKPAGAYQIVAYAHSALTNTFSLSQTVNVTVDPMAATPTFSVASGTYNSTQSVVISTTTSNATVRYTTDGSEPTESSAVASSGVGINTSQTIKAKAFRSGWLSSPTSTAVYVLQVITPGLSPAAGTYQIGQAVTFSVSDGAATIGYTTNGSDPTESSPSIGSGQSITLSDPATIQARAFRTGFSASTAVAGTYTLKLPTPSLSPLGGEFSSAPTVSMSTSPTVSGVTYRYTLNGDEPSSSSSSTSGSLSVPLESTLSVKAQKTGWVDSDTSTEVYVSDTPPPMSTGTISVTGVAATGFVASNGVATFTMSQPVLSTSADDIAVYRDSTALTVNIVNTSTFTVGGLMDGRNNLDIFGVDSQGLPFEGYATVWAGNRSVSVTTVNRAGTPLSGITVAGRLSDDEAMAANATSGSNGVSALASTPTAYALHVEATAAGYRLAETVVGANTTSVTLMLEEDNNDFSGGAAGWTGNAADVRLMNHSEAFLGWERCDDCIIRPNGATGNALVTNGCRTTFTDDPLVAGTTPLKRVHITELREAVDCVRQQQGLAAFSWTDPALSAGTTPVRAVHVTDLRTALSAAYASGGFAAPTFTDATLAGVAVRAMHVMELREFVAPTDTLASAAGNGAGDADLWVTTKNAAGTQTATRSFHVYGGTSTISVRYRFASAELSMTTRMNDTFQVRLRNVTTGAPPVTDAQSVVSLIGQCPTDPSAYCPWWRPTGATDWRTLSLPMQDNQEVEISLTVANAVDLAGISLIIADVVQEKRVNITAFELYDGPTPSASPIDGPWSTFEALKYLSVSQHAYNGGHTDLRGTVSINGQSGDHIQSLVLEVFEAGALKRVEPLTTAAMTAISGSLGDGAAITSPAIMFSLSSPGLSSAINQIQDGSLTLQIRVVTQAGYSDVKKLGFSSIGGSKARPVTTLTRYDHNNRSGHRDIEKCLVEDPTNRWYGEKYPCLGDDWALPSTVSRTSGIAMFTFPSGGQGVACDDFSNMNGNYFPPHNSHRRGTGVDCKFGINAAATFNVTGSSARKIVDLLRAQPQIEFVYATYRVRKDGTGQPVTSVDDLTDFWKEIRFATLADGVTRLIPEPLRVALEAAPLSSAARTKVLIRNWPGHSRHMHIQWRQ